MVLNACVHQSGYNRKGEHESLNKRHAIDMCFCECEEFEAVRQCARGAPKHNCKANPSGKKCDGETG